MRTKLTASLYVYLKFFKVDKDYNFQFILYYQDHGQLNNTWIGEKNPLV